MAKQADPINPFIAPEIDAAVRQRIEANPGGDVTAETFYVRVFHNNDPTRQRGEFCGRIDYRVFSEEVVAERFGLAGDFTGQICCSNGAKVKGTVREFPFSVSPAMIPARPAAPTPAAGLGGAAAPAAPTLNIETVLLAMMKSQGDLLAALITRPAPPPPPPSSISDTLLTTLLTHTLQKTPVGELVEAAKSFGIKLGGAAPKERDDQDDAPVGGAIIEGLKLVRDMWAGSQSPAAPTAPAAADAPTPPTPTTPNPAAPAAKEPAVSLQSFIDAALPALIAAAARQPRDVPAAAAELTQKAAAAGVQLEQFVSRKPRDVVQLIRIAHPEASPAAEFIEEVLAHVQTGVRLRAFYVRAVGMAVDAAGDPEPDVDATATSIEGLAERFNVPDSQLAGMDPAKEADELVGVFPAAKPHRDWIVKVWTELKERASDDEEAE